MVAPGQFGVDTQEIERVVPKAGVVNIADKDFLHGQLPQEGIKLTCKSINCLALVRYQAPQQVVATYGWRGKLSTVAPSWARCSSLTVPRLCKS
jgi:hypothetical protein